MIFTQGQLEEAFGDEIAFDDAIGVLSEALQPTPEGFAEESPPRKRARAADDNHADYPRRPDRVNSAETARQYDAWKRAQGWSTGMCNNEIEDPVSGKTRLCLQQCNSGAQFCFDCRHGR
jgi:hypothetical protein